MRNLFLLMLLVPFSLFFNSCASTKATTYFNNAVDTTFLVKYNNIEGKPKIGNVIQKNDILGISITSLNQDASAVFNTANSFIYTSSTSSGLHTQASGYLVNTDGILQLPLIGNLKAEGLTKDELKDLIKSNILEKHLLLDPIVNIRHLNYEVTVIGEVGNPSVINVPNEKITLLKALGLAGDITIYGKKDNVLLIRETDSIKTVKYLDLNSKNFLNSPYYYLKPNDIVYVQANKNKVASAGRGTRLLPVFLSGMSVIILLVDRVLYK